MKILIVANSGQFLRLFKRELLTELIRRGHELTVVSPLGDMRGEIESWGCATMDIPLDRRGKNPFKDFALYRRYKRIIAEEKPHKIITYTVKPNIFGGWAARRSGVPYYACVTGLGTGFQRPFLRAFLKCLYRRALKKAVKVFFENAGNMQVFIDRRLIKAEQAVLVSGSGVNLDEFSFQPLPEGKTKFLFFGRVMKEKGIAEFLSAACRAREEGLNAEFHILGGCEENYKSTLDKLCAEGIIVYHGFSSSVKEFIADCHAVVLPSYHEGMSNALLESAAMGRPLITSNISGCKEAVQDGVSGFLCEVKSEQDLYEKIKKFAALTQEERQAMGRASREHIEKNFDRKSVNEKTLAEMEIE